jgi:hypothetical protein
LTIPRAFIRSIDVEGALFRTASSRTRRYWDGRVPWTVSTNREPLPGADGGSVTCIDAEVTRRSVSDKPRAEDTEKLAALESADTPNEAVATEETALIRQTLLDDEVVTASMELIPVRVRSSPGDCESDVQSSGTEPVSTKESCLCVAV